MSLLTPDFGLVFWMFLCFLIVLFVLSKFAWPMIIGMINKRGEYIENSLKAAQEANEKLKTLQMESDKILSEAKNKQVDILKEAKQLKELIISDAKNQAQIEANKIFENAQENIRRERENAVKDIRVQVTELSVVVAEKVLRKELADKESQIEMIDRLLDEINIVKS